MNIGETVKILFGKYKGEIGEITSLHVSHSPLLYTVILSNGIEIALFETEIEKISK